MHFLCAPVWALLIWLVATPAWSFLGQCTAIKKSNVSIVSVPWDDTGRKCLLDHPYPIYRALATLIPLNTTAHWLIEFQLSGQDSLWPTSIIAREGKQVSVYALDPTTSWAAVFSDKSARNALPRYCRTDSTCLGDNIPEVILNHCTTEMRSCACGPDEKLFLQKKGYLVHWGLDEQKVAYASIYIGQGQLVKIYGLVSAPADWRVGMHLPEKSYLGLCPPEGKWKWIPYWWEAPFATESE